jgi:hypothetical protein
MRRSKVWIVFYYGKANGPFSDRQEAARLVSDLRRQKVDAAYSGWRCPLTAEEFVAWHNYENAHIYEHHGI